MKTAEEVATVAVTTGREIGQVEVLIKSQRRTMTFEVFAREDPLYALQSDSRRTWDLVVLILTGRMPL